jgi:serine/threonine protein kinase
LCPPDAFTVSSHHPTMASHAAPACPECGTSIGSDGICAICLARDTALIDQGATHPSASGIFDVPAAIGPFSIIRVLGEGGMGIVYLAEQAEPFRRQVALKVIKIGMNTREVVARFEGERQALAMMSHSHIAQIYGAGVTDDGRPYFVMEHVPGVPITDYCEQNELSTRARLELFVLVCGAIEHAHQKGIIHRDVKPHNVLVTVQDGRPVPKVIDFGVAKATRQRLTEKTVFTHLGLLIGTPEYMSPEQALLGGAEITSSTDIYSLGVLLYELLVSALPFDPTALRRAGYAEIQRIIREDEPVPPSTRLSGLGKKGAEVAQRRHTDLATLGRELKGDLDWIALKALEKEPAMRYLSASELAADVSRYLHSDRVLARPSSLRSRLRRSRRLHPRAAAAISVLMLVLVAGILWITTSASGVTLTVTKPLGGTVIGGGLVCGTHGTTCSTKRTASDVVELHILTDPGSIFAGFGGDCTPAGHVLMNRAKTCVATFTQVGPAPTTVAPVGPAPSGLAPAERLFYEMKAQDVIIARLQEDLVRTGTTVSPEDLKALQDRRRQLEQFYEQVASDAYGRLANERERLILRVTRLLGECEVAAPPDYLREVNRYIEQWRSTPRFEQAVKRAQENGYTRTIAAAFMARQLPPQYFYLAMQESGFSPTTVGPSTRFGIAKGMWQFLPETGLRYGLKTGPYYSDQRIDPADERLDWEKATRAAASYIKDIYSTDAQASGLLVMASYSWGERRVIDQLKKMPLNPRERNFWTLLTQHPDAVSRQTYDYVFFIVSAAVIGENPRLFGFQFDNPLAFTPSR